MSKFKSTAESKGIGKFFRGLLHTFSAPKKNSSPLPKQITAPIAAMPEEAVHAPSATIPVTKRKPLIDDKLSTKELYDYGIKAFKNKESEDSDITAARYFSKAAVQGHPLAQSHLAYMYKMGFGIEKSPEQALLWSLKAAEQSIADAEFIVGTSYFTGSGTKADTSLAIKWLEKAAQHGITEAQRYLGDIYSHYLKQHKTPLTLHHLPAIDLKVALDWYLLATQSNDDFSQLRVGMIYSNQNSEHYNQQKAIHYFEQSSNNENEEAQYHLGMILLSQGKEVKFYKKALENLFLSAQSRYPDALYQLGIMYASGDGVKMNTELSKSYLTLAAQCGHKAAKIKLYDTYDIFLEESSQKQRERISVKVHLI